MILLLSLAAWIVVLSLVVGLCAAAHVGDGEQLAPASGQAGWSRAEPHGWEQAGHVAISARANVSSGPPAQADAPLLHSGGVAA